MTGFVSFVSSGPGDPDLLTVRALKRLQQAEAVLYDDLASGPILDLAHPQAEMIAVGKRAGCPSPKQEEVSRRLVEQAGMGRRVVRLKSGDAGVFGRLEEEIAAVTAAGLPFEVVPGVTSAAAAAAAASIPLTRRLTARRLQFVTGHDVTGALPEAMNLAALADPEAVTAVYMGRRTFAALAARLIAAGLPPDTPALMAEEVSKPGQRFVSATVADLAEALREAPSRAVVMILYGALAEPRLP
ncbi:uroporphyrinogen-III C-methyltransferase [Salipiger marinus]|jgi:uroporphyrin-III C-methyltransferase|uniref:uroporphyrinogen-III C-methyltransferase n=1 Tax=Salipiger marinus TaxID=555512 RepID=A0A1G8PP55_9RHOB|nr:MULTISPECIES: uroporphyrinogen-III C-methyltransferase [Salipiger]MEB3420289.1 uroporphyrinogen-III C-methyltransferase [Salipiger manganoxidans]SDI94172.1 uroporphyrinogen-III C-methyltransferase [Salipiger marinus]HBM61435.1 uroporphyrinogen-III C-methyltransferase [Citreicella sp.]HBT00182.1 uroporphyrinogen-III C-methyltransferase [Citreicella sp.]